MARQAWKAKMTMARKTKTILVAVYPDGREWIIRRETLGWRWRHDAWSSHLPLARHQVEAAGGRIERRANPDWSGVDALDEMLGRLFR